MKISLILSYCLILYEGMVVILRLNQIRLVRKHVRNSTGCLVETGTQVI